VELIKSDKFERLLIFLILIAAPSVPVVLNPDYPFGNGNVCDTLVYNFLNFYYDLPFDFHYMEDRISAIFPNFLIYKIFSDPFATYFNYFLWFYLLLISIYFCLIQLGEKKEALVGVLLMATTSLSTGILVTDYPASKALVWAFISLGFLLKKESNKTKRLSYIYSGVFLCFSLVAQLRIILSLAFFPILLFEKYEISRDNIFKILKVLLGLIIGYLFLGLINYLFLGREVFFLRDTFEVIFWSEEGMRGNYFDRFKNSASSSLFFIGLALAIMEVVKKKEFTQISLASILTSLIVLFYIAIDGNYFITSNYHFSSIIVLLLVFKVLLKDKLNNISVYNIAFVSMLALAVSYLLRVDIQRSLFENIQFGFYLVLIAFVFILKIAPKKLKVLLIFLYFASLRPDLHFGKNQLENRWQKYPRYTKSYALKLRSEIQEIVSAGLDTSPLAIMSEISTTKGDFKSSVVYSFLGCGSRDIVKISEIPKQFTFSNRKWLLSDLDQLKLNRFLKKEKTIKYEYVSNPVPNLYLYKIKK
tara:strand:+ start:1443 stop:3035 length:1593 start_codon:yes stop_codon:yes gene_type:complete